MKQLNVALKAVRLYPPTSTIPRESASAAVATLRSMFQTEAEMRLVVTRDGLFHDGESIFPDSVAFREFTRDLYSRRLAEVRFHSGVTIAEILDFLMVLDTPREELTEPGAFEERLWDANVVNVTIAEATTRIVEETPEEVAVAVEETVDDWPPDRATIDEIISGAFGGRSRDQRILVRVVESPELVAQYLERSLETRGSMSASAWVSARVSALAHALEREMPEDRSMLYRSIAEAVMGLDTTVRREALRDRMLPDARHDEALAEVVRQIGLDEVCGALVEEFEHSAVSQDGLARALRNLVLVSDHERTEIVDSARAALETSGADEEFISGVLEGVSPTRLSVEERAAAPDRPSPLARIIKLIDVAPRSKDEDEAEGDDPVIAQLAEEARSGISDGDVLGALVRLVTLEARPEQFNTIMSLIEDSVVLLVERQEYAIAALAAEGLLSASRDPERDPSQASRLLEAVELLADKKQMRAIVVGMRRFDKESAEHQACRRLLSVLGSHSVSPLLEILADEPDRSARKALVDLISENADAHSDELGRRLSDDRWYFVRNVVTILGASNDHEGLSHLERTLRHRDARVRRETIRAVSAMREAKADEMLVAALSDPDSQNVQLAARYLGTRGNKRLAPSLEQVARGEGRGSREVPVRIEAIEALGRLAAPSSAPVLESLSKKRAIAGRSRAREVKTAAKAALSALMAARTREGGSR